MSFVKETRLGSKRKLTTQQKTESDELRVKARKEDEKLVKGVFKNVEAPGAEAMFSFRAYKEHPIQTYTLQDGEVYEIPMGVAKHINRQCRYQRSANLVDVNGKPMVGVGKPIQRYEFTPTDYM